MSLCAILCHFYATLCHFIPLFVISCHYVITIWKMAICKWGILKCPVSHLLKFRGWILLIYDKISLIYCVKNAFNPTSEVQNIENRVFQNALFANSCFPNGYYSCLWAIILLKFFHLILSTSKKIELGSGPYFHIFLKSSNFSQNFT